jgi:alkanesulfonate monooxygenase SsuD/methylene tetrahydromethanopterin reductase-like flavin-dependent oxidoreductase (luciferase family)
VVDFQGRFHRVDRAGIAPRPARTIPIWLGGGSEASLRRAARTGDGFTFAGAGRSTAAQAEKLRGMLTEEGRDPATFPMEFGLPYGVGPERWQKSVQLAADGGISHLSVNTMSTAAAWAKTEGSGLTTPAEHIAGIERFITTVRG